MCSGLTCPRASRPHAMSPSEVRRTSPSLNDAQTDQSAGPVGKTLTLDTADGWVVVVFLCAAGSYWPGPANPNPFAMCISLKTFSMDNTGQRAARITVFSTPADAAVAWHRRRRPVAGALHLRWPPACTVQAWHLRRIRDWSTPPADITPRPARDLTHWSPTSDDLGPWLIATPPRVWAGTRGTAHHPTPPAPTARDPHPGHNSRAAAGSSQTNESGPA